MNKFTKIPALLAAVALSLGLSAAHAADNATVTVTSTVPEILSLEVSTNTVGITLVDSDYDVDGVAAKLESAAHTVSIRSNIAWTLNVKANSSTFSGTGTSGKAIADLEIQTPGSVWAALTTSDVAKENGVGGAYGDNTFSVDYRFNSTLQNDGPGTYVAEVVFTAVPESLP